MSTWKPLDEEAIVKAALETGAIVTVEEHFLRNGLGSAVAQITAARAPVPMAFIAIDDVYSKSGKPEELLRQRGLTSDNIRAAASALAAKKGHRQQAPED